MWVESFTARYHDGKVDATCRLQNEDWDEWRNALLSWAISWPTTPGFLVTFRQFLLMEPTPVEQLQSAQELTDTLGREMRRRGAPWWRRLGRRGD